MCKSYSHFFCKNTCELDIVLTIIVNILTRCFENWALIASHKVPVLNSEEANWSGSALFAIKYLSLYEQSGSSDLIGWKLEVGVAA